MDEKRSSLSRSSLNRFLPLLALATLITDPGKAKAMSEDIPFLPGDDHRFIGVFPDSKFWFYIPETWEIRSGSTLHLKFRHSTILLPDWSTFTVSVNEKTIKTLRLSHPDLLWHTDETGISKDTLRPGWNEIEFRFYQRSVKDPCTEIDNPGLWTMLSKDSKFHILFDLKRVEPDLSLFPFSYIVPSKARPEPPQVLFYFPETGSSSHLQVAAILASRLGQTKEVKERGLMAVRIGKDELPSLEDRKRANLVFVGLPEEYETLLDAGFSRDFVDDIRGMADSTMEKYGYLTSPGFIMERRSPFNPYKRILIVSGRDEQGLLITGSNFSRTDVTAQFSGEFQVFAQHPPILKYEPRDESKVSFASLNLNDLTVRGIFSKVVSFTVQVPGNWKLNPGSYLFLYLSHSILLKKASIFELSLNRTPVFSLELTPNLPGEEVSLKELKIPIPENQLNTRKFDVELQFFLDIGSEDCSRPYDESAWAVVRNDSFFYFDHGISNKADLSYYPDIFLRDRNVNDLYYVVSDDPVGAEIEIMLMSSALMGYHLSKQKEIYPRVLAYSLFMNIDKSSKDFFMIGSPTRNRTLVELENQLPVILDGKGRISSVSRKVYHLPEFGSDAGLLELRFSPWDSSRYQLFAMAISEEGMDKVSYIISSAWPEDVLKGDITFILDKDKTLNFVTYEEEEEEAGPPEKMAAAGREEEGDREWIKYLVISIIVLGIIALIIYVILKTPRGGELQE